MRKSWTLLLVVVGALAGYSARSVPAVAQAEFQPFVAGQVVRLSVEGFVGGPTIDCKVTTVANDFIHCATDGPRGPRAVNLRYVKEVTAIPQR